MPNRNDAIFTYDPENHITTCVRTVKNKTYVGTSKCHPHDWDFESKLVGEHYAYVRSVIHEAAEDRDAARNELKALYHMYSLYNHSSKINLKSYECYLLRRQIKAKEKEISHLRDVIKTAKANLRATIAAKDVFYNTVREGRKKNAAE